MQKLRGQRLAQEGRKGGEVPALQGHGGTVIELMAVLYQYKRAGDHGDDALNDRGRIREFKHR
jgi:hypothetical protein